jgi:hypothetical protein
MVDRTLKALLFAIVLGLWMQVAGDWVRPDTVSIAAANDARPMP